TEDSVRTALRTQQIIAYESGVANAIDPLAGSYFVDKLTDDLEAQATAYIEKIDELGGMVAAIEQAYVQRQIEHSAYEVGRAIERGEGLSVGGNKFQSQTVMACEIFVVREATARKQNDCRNPVKQQRDQVRVRQTLDALERGARGDDNVMR